MALVAHVDSVDTQTHYNRFGCECRNKTDLAVSGCALTRLTAAAPVADNAGTMYAGPVPIRRATASRLAHRAACVCLNVVSIACVGPAWGTPSSTPPGNPPAKPPGIPLQQALPPPNPVPAAAPLGAVKTPPVTPRAALSWSAKGGILAGLGVLSFGIGTWAGLQALSYSRDAGPHCGTGMYTDVCNPEGLALREEGRRYTTTATAGIMGSVPLLIFGTWLLAAAPMTWEQRTVADAQSDEPALEVGLTPGGLAVGGRF